MKIISLDDKELEELEVILNDRDVDICEHRIEYTKKQVDVFRRLYTKCLR